MLCPARAPRSSRVLALLRAGGLVILLALGIPAAASAGAAGYEVTCFSSADCASRLDPVMMPDGGLFDFDYGVKALADDLVLDVTTSGSIFVRGNLVTDGGDIHLTGDQVFLLDGTTIQSTLDPIEPPVLPPPIVPGGPPGGGVIICACITVIALPELPPLVVDPGNIRIVDDSLVLEGLAFPPPQPKKPGDPTGGAILIDHNGDIHIDASMVSYFDSIRLDAGDKLVIDGGGLKVPNVPEPGTAVLLGLGLAALAGGRQSGGRSR